MNQPEGVRARTAARGGGMAQDSEALSLRRDIGWAALRECMGGSQAGDNGADGAAG